MELNNDSRSDDNLNNCLINVPDTNINYNQNSSFSSSSSNSLFPTDSNKKKRFNRIHSSQIDFDIRNQKLENNENNLIQEKLDLNIKHLHLYHIYLHLNERIDWIFITLGIIGSIGAGVSMPIMTYTTSDVYSEIANTSENRDTQEHTEEMLYIVKKALDYQVKRQLIYGMFSFTFYFINIFFWSLIGNRCIYNLKKKYFSLILKQDQGWFDANNPFQIATDVHSQIEDIDMLTTAINNV